MSNKNRAKGRGQGGAGAGEAGAPPGQQVPITHESSWSVDGSPRELLTGSQGLSMRWGGSTHPPTNARLRPG